MKKINFLKKPSINLLKILHQTNVRTEEQLFTGQVTKILLM